MGIPESALSTNDGHGTPKEILDPIVRCLGRIGLDPCSNPDSIVESDVAYLLPAYAPHVVRGAGRTIYGDGRLLPWLGVAPGRITYVNPPYSDGKKKKPRPDKPPPAPVEGGLADFLALAWQLRRDHNHESIMMVPSRTGNVYWPEAAGKADVEIRLGRVTHVGSTTHSPFHQLLLYYGPRVEQALGLACLGDVRVHPRHTLLRPAIWQRP